MVCANNKKALSIGTVCVTLYVVNYFLRNVLSVLTPQMLETGEFTVAHIGNLSSTYMLFYAIGQLINGFLGDILSPKKMIVGGITLAGLVTLAFPFTPIEPLQVLLFALLGFSLSMLRGPLMKTISENTAPNQARLICVFFSCAGFVGPLVASLVAMLNNWTWSFIVSGVISLASAVVAYIVLSAMEKNGTIKVNKVGWQGFSGLLAVFKIEKFFFYMAIACLTEISGAAITFWIPTYLTDALLFEKTTANMIYSAISIVRAMMPFVALFIFRLVNEKDIPMTRVSFAIATAAFTAMYFLENRILNLALFILALVALSCVSALLWSIYIPSLGKTGRVSSVNGVLDCSGYAAAALTNLVFAGAVAKVGWSGVIIIWALLGVAGIITTFFANKRKKDA